MYALARGVIEILHTSVHGVDDRGGTEWSEDGYADMAAAYGTRCTTRSGGRRPTLEGKDCQNR